MELLQLFCKVDNFCQTLIPFWHSQLLASGAIRRLQPSQLASSEVMTIMIHFHQSHYRDFKAYYTKHVMRHLEGEFPNLVSYNRFVELQQSVLIP